MKAFTSHSLTETEQIAKDWLVSISNMHANPDQSSRLDGALIVGLSGHLGAGKTAFTKCVAKLLGIQEEITSPTFVIMKIYDIKKHEIRNSKSEENAAVVPWKRLIHIDAYRLERREELEVLEWEKLVADKNNLILIEWPENVGLKRFDPQALLRFEAGEIDYSISIE
jgi:tRNA A37 threonylcarbamoyladenosine biosynthesis protein TsaE